MIVIAKRFSLLFLTVFLQLIVAIGFVEILGQLFFSNPYPGDRRYLYTTPDAVRNHNEFWTYRANIEIHEVSVYESAIGTLFKGSDCTYESDRLGFLDNQAADRGPYDTLILAINSPPAKPDAPGSVRCARSYPANRSTTPAWRRQVLPCGGAIGNI